MRGAVPRSPAIQTATYEVEFPRRPAPERASSEAPVGRLPRVTRLLALAHRIDGMITSGEVRDWAEAARLVGVTRARVTQIANLLLLAPKIQEGILSLPSVTRGPDLVTERVLREVASHVDWRAQNMAWIPLRQRLVSPPAA